MQICLIIITGCSFYLDHQWPKTVRRRIQAQPTVPGGKRHAMASTDLTVFSYNVGLSDVGQFKPEGLKADLQIAKGSRLSAHQP
jgi:hypothetical protein